MGMESSLSSCFQIHCHSLRKQQHLLFGHSVMNAQGFGVFPLCSVLYQHTHAHAHTHTHTHIHAHIHTHIHTVIISDTIMAVRWL